MSMLLSLFSSLALAWPQAPTTPDYSQHTALEVLPADTLAVVEFSLEPWDRLRSQTRAAKVLSGQKLLRTALADMSLPEGMSSEGLRKALGGVRFTLAVTEGSVFDMGFTLAVEVVGLNGAEFDWPAALRQLGATSTQKIKQGWMVALPFPNLGSVPEGALPSWIGDLKEPRLVQHQAWKDMRAGMVTSNDIARVSIPIWTLDAELLSRVMDEDNVIPDSDFWDALLRGYLGDRRDRVCLMYSATIDGEDILERSRMDFGTHLASVFTPVGTTDELLRLCAQAPVDAAMVSVSGISGSAAGDWMRNLIFESLVPLFGPTGDDLELIESYVSPFIALAKCFGPRVISYSSMDSLDTGVPVLMRVQTTGRASLEEKWEAMPNEVQGIVPFALAEFGALKHMNWHDDEMVLGLDPGDWLEPSQHSSQRWFDLINQIKSFAGDSPLLSIRLSGRELDGYWLTQPAPLRAIELFGLSIPRLTWSAETEELRRPSYLAMRANGRWLETESRTTFGTVFNALNDELLKLLQGSTVDELDESEF